MIFVDKGIMTGVPDKLDYIDKCLTFCSHNTHSHWSVWPRSQSEPS